MPVQTERAYVLGPPHHQLILLLSCHGPTPSVHTFRLNAQLVGVRPLSQRECNPRATPKNSRPSLNPAALVLVAIELPGEPCTLHAYFFDVARAWMLSKSRSRLRT